MRFILVTSGKGGTGKTLYSLNLAHALSKRGIKVSILDADLDDPNTFQMLGMTDEMQVTKEKKFTPMIYDGIEMFSMAGISGDRPVSMEGTQYGEILQDVIDHTDWHSDYCVVDMPAGSADTFRTMLMAFSESLLGSIIVMQPAHVESARKAIELHQKEGIPILGVVENMSSFKCECGKEHDIFGGHVVDKLAEQYGVNSLGHIPLSMDIKRAVENRKPFLDGDMAKPVEMGADAVQAAQLISPSLFGRLKEGAKGLARNVLLDLMSGLISIINTEVPIADYQKEHGFSGGRTIELDITDRTLRIVKVQIFFRIEDGVLKVVKSPKDVDTEIRMWDKAFIWSVLGWRPVQDKRINFDFMDGWLLGEIKFSGVGGDTQRAVSFFKGVWKDLGPRAKENKKLLGMLERLA